VTKLLKKAFDEASKLTESDQDSIGEWLLAEIESEREWDRLFSRSQDLLSRLAKQALEDHRRGLTEEIDPDSL